MEHAGAIEIQITCGSASEADAISTTLVERRLAACCQQLPIRSTYRWEGAVERDDEILVLVKTRREHFAAIADMVTAIHSYDVPAITFAEIVGGAPDYLTWIDTETELPASD